MKKISFYLLLSSALLITTFANAQKIALGVRGGVSIPNLSTGGDVTNPLNEGYKSRFGPDFAVFAEFKVSKMFSLQPMIEYSAQGGKKTGLQAFPTPSDMAAMYPPGYPVPTYMYAKYDNTAKLNYLMIPVLAKFGWNLGAESPVRLYVNAGPFVSFLVSAHQVLEGTSAIYADADGQQQLAPEQKFDRNLDIRNNLRSANFGVQANLGLSYTIKRSSIFVEGGFNYGFVNIQKDAANGKNQTGAATASIGYAYWFGK